MTFNQDVILFQAANFLQKIFIRLLHQKEYSLLEELYDPIYALKSEKTLLKGVTEKWLLTFSLRKHTLHKEARVKTVT